MVKTNERMPLIFDIKRSSTTDGPGLRTVIFLKGCNLDCFWCHNSEGKKPEKQLAFFSEKCIFCGVCQDVCPVIQKNRAAKKTCPAQKKYLLAEHCIACGKCVAYCPAQARKSYGREYSKEELLEIILADMDYYLATGGGITISGGECMLYPEFVADMAKRCQQRGISVSIDTAGAVPYTHFEKVLPYVDIFLYDIKCLDSELHRKGTGCGNRQILENLEKLRQTGKRILIRIPEIPGFNKGKEAEQIKRYCEERNLSYEVLAYHAMGEGKLQALKRDI